MPFSAILPVRLILFCVELHYDLYIVFTLYVYIEWNISTQVNCYTIPDSPIDFHCGVAHTHRLCGGPCNYIVNNYAVSTAHYGLTVLCNWSLQFPLVRLVCSCRWSPRSPLVCSLQWSLVSGFLRLKWCCWSLQPPYTSWSETAELRTDKSRHYDCTIIRMMYNCTIGMMYHIMLYYAGSSLVCQPMHFCHADLRWLARLVLVDDSVLKAI